MVISYGLNARVYERWMCRYNRRKRYPCPIKGCTHKLRNGRCSLDMCRLEVREDKSFTGSCLDFKYQIIYAERRI